LAGVKIDLGVTALPRAWAEPSPEYFTLLAFMFVQGSGPDLPIGYIVLSLGPKDSRGPPTNCGTHRANGLHVII